MAVETFKLPRSPQDPPPLRIEQFKGINLSVTPTQIDDNQSPDMLNMNIDERGALNKRTGYERVYPTTLGVGQINGIYRYKKIDGTNYNLVAHGTKLYTFLLDGTQPIEIYNGLANSKATFFTMNDKCYIMDGTNYLVYDGTTVASVTPYIPTITIASGSVAIGYESFEDWNLLSRGFKETRSGDGTTKAFNLSQTNLDADTVTILVNNVAKVENTDFTVNRTTGVITFTTAPSVGTNNIEITAYKTYTGLADKVKQATLNIIYGGSQDTRVFIAKDEYVRTSGLNDPTYWPENRFYKFNDIVKGFAKQYDYLVIERTNGKHAISFTLNADGTASFPSRPINDQVGTLASGSIQLIENNPVSLSKDGVYMLVASSVRDERNVQHISENVDSKLLKEPNLEQAISIDYDRKYWLAVNGNVYVFDYAIGEWYIYDNIYATQFLELDGYLYFGGLEGLIYRFKKESDILPFNDDNEAIIAYWKSKHFAYGIESRMKLVEKLGTSLKPYPRTSVEIYTTTNKKDRKYLTTIRMDLFNYGLIDYSKYTYLTNVFPQSKNKKVKAKKITYFQTELRNDKLNESMGILSHEHRYSYQGDVK